MNKNNFRIDSVGCKPIYQQLNIGVDIARDGEDISCMSFMRGDTIVGVLYGESAEYVHNQAQRIRTLSEALQTIATPHSITDYKFLVEKYEEIAKKALGDCDAKDTPK